MPETIARSFRTALLIACAIGFASVTPTSYAGDAYDAAVHHAGRSSADLKRDRTDKPADVLRLSGIKPGMQVADVLASDGYYSELLSYVVGSSGHVLLLNNDAYDKFSNNAWRDRIDKHRLTNVEHRTVDMASMGLGAGTLDAAVLIKVYHDLYWVAPQDGWPKIDVSGVLDQLSKALKPGGILVVVDHSAKPDTGSTPAQDLHRIDEAYARKDFRIARFRVRLAKRCLAPQRRCTRQDLVQASDARQDRSFRLRVS